MISNPLMFCALDMIRTYDLLLRRQALYPLSYEGQGTENNITSSEG